MAYLMVTVLLRHTLPLDRVYQSLTKEQMFSARAHVPFSNKRRVFGIRGRWKFQAIAIGTFAWRLFKKAAVLGDHGETELEVALALFSALASALLCLSIGLLVGPAQHNRQRGEHRGHRNHHHDRIEGHRLLPCLMRTTLVPMRGSRIALNQSARDPIVPETPGM